MRWCGSLHRMGWALSAFTHVFGAVQRNTYHSITPLLSQCYASAAYHRDTSLQCRHHSHSSLLRPPRFFSKVLIGFASRNPSYDSRITPRITLLFSSRAVPFLTLRALPFSEKH